MNNENMKLIKIILPIIVIGIIAIYVIMKSVKQSKNGIESDKKTYLVEGMTVGMVLGIGVAVSLGRENIPMGIAIGMLLGMAVGINSPKKDK